MAPSNPQTALRKRLEQRVRVFMLDRELWPNAGPLILAVSGGPDSTALLLILNRLAKYRRVRLHVAYFDHALRSAEERQAEAAFVRRLCEAQELPLVTGQGDVKGRAKRDRTSVEDAARRERYDFLAQTAREIGASTVATGHTASDQAETVLLHIIRGSGLDGLVGMRAASGWPFAGAEALTLARPLLRLSRTETRLYCEAAGIEPIEDESNASPNFVRNRVRNELLPLLRTFNPKVEDALVRLSEAAEERGSSAIRTVLGEVAGDTQSFTATHVEAVDRLLRSGTTGDRVSLPRSMQARRTRGGVVVEDSETATPLPGGSVSVGSGSEVRFGHLLVASGARPAEGACQAVEIDAEALDGLRVRRRRAGDRLQPAGMQGTKKLQDLFVDAHVPREERDRVPIFESERGIVWVGGLRTAEWAKPRPGRPTVWLSYREAQ